MSENSRNVAVGITVLLALCALGYMILLFGELPSFLRPGYTIRLEFPGTGSVQPGAEVNMYGKSIGRVERVDFRENPRDGVVFTCTIDPDVRIPGDVNPYIYSRALIGGGYLELKSDGQPPGAQRGLDWIPRDGYTLSGGKLTGGILPEDIEFSIREAAKGLAGLGSLTENLNRVLVSLVPPADQAAEPTTATTATATTAATQPAPAGLAGTMARLNQALDAFTTVFGDPENQQNLKTALANLRDASASGAEAMKSLAQVATKAQQSFNSIQGAADGARQRMDEVAGALVVQADNLGKLLTTLGQAAGKMESGEGTMGKMLNDPALYNNLLDATRQLKQTLEDFDKTIRLWQRDGLPLKLR